MGELTARRAVAAEKEVSVHNMTAGDIAATAVIAGPREERAG